MRLHSNGICATISWVPFSTVLCDTVTVQLLPQMKKKGSSHLTSPSNECGRRSARVRQQWFGPAVLRMHSWWGPFVPLRVHHRSPGVLAAFSSRDRTRRSGWFKMNDSQSDAQCEAHRELLPGETSKSTDVKRRTWRSQLAKPTPTSHMGARAEQKRVPKRRTKRKQLALFAFLPRGDRKRTFTVRSDLSAR